MKKVSVCSLIIVAVTFAVSCSDVQRNPGKIYMPDMAYSRAYETYATTDSIKAELLKKGATVRAYDPAAIEKAKVLLPGIEYRRNAYAVARGADGVVLVTEWNEFRHLDMAKLKRTMRRPVLVDGRNIYDPAHMRGLGFVYRGIGRN